MNALKIVAVLAAFPLAGCMSTPVNEPPAFNGAFAKDNKTYDRGIDRKHLSELKAGIWVDPNGCDHWLIDDGIEGYLSQRLDKYGKPVCSGIAPPSTLVGPAKAGSTIVDPI